MTAGQGSVHKCESADIFIRADYSNAIWTF